MSSRTQGLAREPASLSSLGTRALNEELRGLARLGRQGLAERWLALYGTAPPPRTSRSLMVRAVAYKMQEKVLGGLKPQTRRVLARLTEDASLGRSSNPPAAPKLSPGTRLVREWQGVTHQVLVLEDGVLFRRQHFRSLSEVARLITGSRWSGPRFFGLNPIAGAKAHAEP